VVKPSTDDESYSVSTWKHGLETNITYHLEPVGAKKPYGSLYLGNTEILDIDAILGIERDEPVLSAKPQRQITPDLPEAPRKRKRGTGLPKSEADKIKHREQTREWSRKPEVKERKKARYWKKKNASTEEEKKKVFFLSRSILQPQH
jgi:Zn-finger nucleic acid-binding protein